MSNPLDITEDDIERIGEWHAEHSILIPVNESCPVAVGFTVWDDIEDDGRFRTTVSHIDATTGIWRQKSVAYLTPEEARRLSDLLLAARPKERRNEQ